jgi:hypothetical protein
MSPSLPLSGLSVLAPKEITGYPTSTWVKAWSSFAFVAHVGTHKVPGHHGGAYSL